MRKKSNNEIVSPFLLKFSATTMYLAINFDRDNFSLLFYAGPPVHSALNRR